MNDVILWAVLLALNVLTASTNDRDSVARRVSVVAAVLAGLNLIRAVARLLYA